MKGEQLERAYIGFNVGKERVEFTVIHNIHSYGQSIESALDNWLARTDEYTVDSFCEYVESKDIKFMCLHEKLKSKLNKKHEAE